MLHRSISLRDPLILIVLKSCMILTIWFALQMAVNNSM